eukprot:TRINITY_DN453_c0_g1_i1.p1 TRINITY_DN453_c0_g1~~TRINITY_DN453_c0_g1_i1.p1  ORF type:complete len:703 (+),score=134.98 TRINITY_DN453_c0_g1_i1:2929-5037(+)
MKRHILFVVLLLSALGYTQNGINYKALIKDNQGNVVANSSILIKFKILESDALTSVYEESHTPTTDINGIIIVNIGEGSIISGIFDDINWGSDEHFLNVKINTGSGFVDMGTTQFSVVPYAFHAKKAANVKGLEPIDEGNGVGWRLIGRNSSNYDSIGYNAIDLSFVDDQNLGLGATGNYAFSLGHNGTASGEHALTFGNQNYALNDYTIALGNNNVVSGLNSTAIGGINQVIGDYAFAAGLQNVASENGAVAMGINAFATAENAIAIGLNASATSAGALAIGRGVVSSGDASTALGYVTESSGQGSTALGVDTEAFGISSLAVGFSSIASTNYSAAIGYETKASGIASIAIGNKTEASDFACLAAGNNTIASGSNATAMGSWTRALGQRSTTLGSFTEASDFASLAMGNQTLASGDSSVAMGYFSIASGDYSTAIGINTIAQSYAQTALGRHNIPFGDSDNWVDTNPLFTIGNGTEANKRNALTVLKNGNVGIGTHTPQELLHISGGRLRIGDEIIEDGGNDVLAFGSSLVPTVDEGDRLGGPNRRWFDVYAANGMIQTSDRRSKTNIANLNYGLAEVLKMQPVSFNWKNKNNPDTKLGLIAQDLQVLVPEVVHAHIWEKDKESGTLIKKELDRLGVYYSDLVPVLINAIKEQQALINALKLSLDQQKSTITNQENIGLDQAKALESLLNRVNILEQTNNQ